MLKLISNNILGLLILTTLHVLMTNKNYKQGIRSPGVSMSYATYLVCTVPLLYAVFILYFAILSLIHTTTDVLTLVSVYTVPGIFLVGVPLSKVAYRHVFGQKMVYGAFSLLKRTPETAVHSTPEIPSREQRARGGVAVAVRIDGRELYQLMNSGKTYDEESPIAITGTRAQVYYRSGHIGEEDRWVLSIPTGLTGHPMRIVPLSPEHSPDQMAINLLERSQELHVSLKPEGRIAKLIESEAEITFDNPIVVGNLAYIYQCRDKIWYLRVSVSRDASREFMIPEAAFDTSETLDQWVLDTIAAVGLTLMRTR